MQKPKRKQPKKPEDFWNHLVGIYLVFMQTNLGTHVELDAAKGKALKLVVKMLRENAENKMVAWTERIATRTLLYFLEFAWRDDSTIKTERWFIISVHQHREELLEKIKLLKSQKQHQCHT